MTFLLYVTVLLAFPVAGIVLERLLPSTLADRALHVLFPTTDDEVTTP